MTKGEFMEYLKYLKQIFPRASYPYSDKAIETWYKPFANTHIKVAENMAQMYFQEEQNSFNFARLLQYKSRAMAGKTEYENSVTENKNCEYCGGNGFVQIEEKVSGRIYQHTYRCLCSSGDKYPNFPKMDRSYLIGKEKYITGLFRIKESS